ncbi:MAG: hypothetical protein V3T05_01400 [Myxococcota bacterium]
MATTYLDLSVEQFRLALRTDCVIGVQNDIMPTDSFQFRGAAYAFGDLRTILAGVAKSPAPFGVAFEADGASAMVGVDSVHHWRPDESTTMRPLPAFGLNHPELFEGALRDDSGLLLVMRPAALAQLTAAIQHDI